MALAVPANAAECSALPLEKLLCAYLGIMSGARAKLKCFNGIMAVGRGREDHIAEPSWLGERVFRPNVPGGKKTVDMRSLNCYPTRHEQDPCHPLDRHHSWHMASWRSARLVAFRKANRRRLGAGTRVTGSDEPTGDSTRRSRPAIRGRGLRRGLKRASATSVCGIGAGNPRPSRVGAVARGYPQGDRPPQTSVNHGAADK